MEKIKVKLKADLTRYGEGFKEGIEGYTIGEYGMWSRGSDRFVGVHFPNVGSLDVLWESLEIIDEDFLKRREQHKKEFLEQLKSVTEATKYVGPRGGFHSLCYSGKEVGHVCLGFKDEALEIEKILKSYGIEVKVVVES